MVNTSWWRGKPNLQKMTSDTRLVESKGAKNSKQPWIGMVVAVAFAALLLYFVAIGKTMLAVAALFGVGFGVLIERGQICFTSAFRDMWISGRTTMTKALALGTAVSVVITFYFIMTGMPALTKIAAPSTAIGGVLFGLGIVLAGGCETGWMYRAMEGQVHFWVVGVGNIIGATALAFAWDHLGIFNTLVMGWPKLNLIEAWGPTGALVGTLVMLGAWYLISSWWEKNYRYGKGLTVQTKSLVKKQSVQQ